MQEVLTCNATGCNLCSDIAVEACVAMTMNNMIDIRRNLQRTTTQRYNAQTHRQTDRAVTEIL